jgi:two-component system nitrogen regulation response regulator NtrX
VDARVISATNRDLRARTDAGDFREDLFYRLNVITIGVPSLWARIDDLEPLAVHFLGETARRDGLSPHELSPAALATLRQHSWPGNVRELQNVIERLVVMADGGRISAPDVERALRPGREATGEDVSIPGLRDARAAFERAFITRSLDAHDWHIQDTAEALGINRSHLWKKMRSLRITPHDDEPARPRG